MGSGKVGRLGLLLAFLSAGATMALAAENESTLARGARLYDKWWAEKELAKPKTMNPLYPNKERNFKDVGDSWRCVECHGWDYKGKYGNFGLGEHFTGIKGVAGAAGRDPAAIAAVLRDANHGYTPEQLDDKDVADLALFVARGQVDLTPYLNPATGRLKGLSARGEIYYNTLCAGCHKLDGTGEHKALGDAAEDRAEALHKIFNGQPGEGMPALRALDPQIAIDVASYLTRLPKVRRR